MTTQDLFNRLTEANFAFTKPCFENEKAFLEEQKKSMNKLIVCGLAEKWAKSLNDIDRRVLVYDCF